MRYVSFAEPERPSYPICILVPVIQRQEILAAYITTHNINPNDVIVIDLHQSLTSKKTPVSEIKTYIAEELVPVWVDLGVEYLVCTDAEYFKVLAGTPKADANLGYVLDSVYGPKVIYSPSHRAIFYDPEKARAKISQAMMALSDHRNGQYSNPGTSIIHFADYPVEPEDIERWLCKFLDEGTELSCDTETFGLKHVGAGIGTISMAWNEHEGIAFPVDLGPNPPLVRAMLRAFFEQHAARVLWHNAAFDVNVLIYQLFMDDVLDTAGLLNGLSVMLRNWGCTKLIAYLATNSCAGNKLSLKDLSQEFAGNYAVDNIKDIRLIPLAELLEYNLIDSLSTWYVFNKHMPTLIADDQLPTYVDVFKPATTDIIQMQLTGLPIDMKRVGEVRVILEADRTRAAAAIHNSPLVQKFTYFLNEKWVEAKNLKLKKKRVTLADANMVFNPASGDQIRDLLFGMLDLPVLSFTDTKQASTDKDALKALKNHTTDPLILDLISALQDHGAVSTILDSFIPAMEAAEPGPDGWHYLFGNFNLGGTLSGRLSSSNPNLQNIPATGSRYAKVIKSCFAAPPGWIFAGLDFDSLEDKISAVTTKDPNKLKVYTDGYDGHCLRAYAYFPDQMSDIDPTSVGSINSISVKYGSLRQKSKVPTFALTYDGTWRTLVTGSGLPEKDAKEIFARYHELYAVSDAWVASKLAQAANDGYITAAFGLRVRTPLLKQTIRGIRKTPYEAQAEGRSAGNALGQSWCLLNSRAGSEFMGKVRGSDFRFDIRPCAQIHDASYFLIRDDIAPLVFTNEHLVKAVEWQEHPDIANDEVKLSGSLAIFWPNWAHSFDLPKGADDMIIARTIDENVEKISSKINPPITPQALAA